MIEKTTKVQQDTGVHVAQFIQEGIGASRQVRITLDRLPLDGDLIAREVAAEAKLTRIPTGILARGTVRARVTLECIRCLEEFTQAVDGDFADEYRPTVNILTGAELAGADETSEEDEFFEISDLHILDLGESLRQALVLALPMAPVCRDDCPGLPEAQLSDGEGDARLAVLARLLGGEQDGADEDDEAASRKRRRAR